jgi:hypothetical protein
MQKVRNILAGLISFLLITAAMPAAVAGAQNSPTGSGLSISPPISEFTINPGDHKTFNITLKNVTVGDVVAKGIINDFEGDGVTGNPKLLSNNAPPTQTSIKKFVSNLDDIPLKKGEQKNVLISLDIPKGTPPGAYFGVIRYQAVPAGSNAPGAGQVALTASVGAIVLITVPGNLREQVQLTGIHVYHGSHDGSLFFAKPDKIGIEIKNFGNGFAKPFGKVEIQNTFGKEIANYEFNNPKQLGNILPSSSRIFMNNINSIKSPGRYKITTNISYGSGSQVLTTTKTIWYIPAWLAIIIALAILALAYLIYRAYRRIRFDNRHQTRRDR